MKRRGERPQPVPVAALLQPSFNRTIGHPVCPFLVKYQAKH